MKASRTRRVAVLVLAPIVAIALFASTAGAATREQLRKPGPRRVLLIGDSITVNYQDATAALLDARGFLTIKAGVGASSLLDENRCKGALVRQMVAFVDPDVVVLQGSGNYANLTPGVGVCRPQVTYGSPAFFKLWTRASKVTQRRALRRKAQVLWVINPTVAFEPKRRAIPQINTIYRQVAGTKAGLIDAWTAFGGPVFDQSLRYDVQHLNAAGARRMAELIDAAIR
jgi:lysophospholipase L1-like esterase